MIGGVVIGGFVVAMCAWMAFGDEDPRWIRGAARNVSFVVAFVAVGAFIFWVLQKSGHIN